MDTPTFNIIGEIGKGNNTLEGLMSFLMAYKKAKEIDINLSTIGGDAQQGEDMFDTLVNCGKTVNMHILGECMSIGTILMLAGDTIDATPNSRFMIHPAWADPGPNNGQNLVRIGQDLIDYSDKLFGYYPTKRTLKVDLATLRQYFDTEKPFDTDTAIQWGLIDGYIKAKAYACATILSTKQIPTINKQMTKPQLSMGARIKNLVKGTKYQMMALTGPNGEAAMTESDATPKIGDAVTLADGSPAPDGDYKLADGTVIGVMGGVVAEVATSAEENTEGEMGKAKATIADLTAKLAEANSKMAELDALKVKAAEADALKLKNTELEAVKAKNSEHEILLGEAVTKIEALQLEVKNLAKTVPGGGTGDPEKFNKQKEIEAKDWEKLPAKQRIMLTRKEMIS